jgi:FkbM family methyltransferase
MPVVGYEIAKTRYAWDITIIASIHARTILERLAVDESALLLSITNVDGLSESDQITNLDSIIYRKELKSNVKILKNQISKNTYEQLHNKRRNRSNFSDLIFVSQMFNSEQYLDYIKRDKIVTAFDAGVHDGYSSLQFLKRFSNLKKIYGFDLFDISLNSGRYIRELTESGKFQLVLGALQKHQDINTFAEFNYNNPSATKINTHSQNVGQLIKSICIDHYCSENNIKFDFIKFDIEGAEMDALIGAKKTLITYRPQIAVSIYHSKYDFIKIPAFLNEILKNYSFYISHYSLDIYETVLYAIPNEIQ